MVYQVTDAPNHYLFRSSRSQMFFKIGVYKNSPNCHRKTPALEYLCNNCRSLSEPATLLKSSFTQSQILSCEIYKVFKNTYFEEHLRWLLLSAIRWIFDRFSPAWRFSKNALYHWFFLIHNWLTLPLHIRNKPLIRRKKDKAVKIIIKNQNLL